LAVWHPPPALPCRYSWSSGSPPILYLQALPVQCDKK
jgi:hypothetical protein